MRGSRWREYAAGALWVLPTIAALVALAAGAVVSQIYISADSAWAPIAFQGRSTMPGHC
jgi:uncharacterized membrane protein